MNWKMQVHVLKSWPIPFAGVWGGVKPFEVRHTRDRFFNEVDLVILREVTDVRGSSFTGRAIAADVGYLVCGGSFGLPQSVAVFGLLNIHKLSNVTNVVVHGHKATIVLENGDMLNIATGELRK